MILVAKTTKEQIQEGDNYKTFPKVLQSTLRLNVEPLSPGNLQPSPRKALEPKQVPLIMEPRASHSREALQNKSMQQQCAVGL